MTADQLVYKEHIVIILVKIFDMDMYVMLYNKVYTT